jgi:hypothetical protein
MTFRPASGGRALQRWGALLIMTAAVAGAMAAAFSIDWGKAAFLLLVAGLALTIPTATLAVRICRLETLRYLVDRYAVVIRDCTGSVVVPMRSLERMKVGGKALRPYRGRRRWPAPFLGIAPVEGLGFVLMRATLPPEEQVFLITPSGSYGVSPADREGFVRAVEERFRLGPTQVPEEDSIPARWRRWIPAGFCFWTAAVGGGILWLFLLATSAWRGRDPDALVLGAGAIWIANGVVGLLLRGRARRTACTVWIVALAVLVLALAAAVR